MNQGAKRGYGSEWYESEAQSAAQVLIQEATTTTTASAVGQSGEKEGAKGQKGREQEEGVDWLTQLQQRALAHYTLNTSMMPAILGIRVHSTTM